MDADELFIRTLADLDDRTDTKDEYTALAWPDSTSPTGRYPPGSAQPIPAEDPPQYSPMSS
jgi:hypothetical protein